MELSTLAFSIGLIEFLIGVPMLVAPRSMSIWLTGLRERDDTGVRLIGVLFLLMAFLVLVRDASIGTDVEGLLRLVAWITAIKCLLLAWWPHRLLGMMDFYFASPARQRLLGVLALGMSGLFTYAGMCLIGCCCA